MSKTRKIAFCGILTALALLLGYVEAMLPAPVPVPGVKLGLPNLAVLLCLYLYDKKTAFTLSVLRVFLTALLFSGFTAFWFSLAGACLSFLVMCAALALKKVSPVGVSVLGGLAHNLGQLVVAGILVENMRIVYYLPVLMVSGIVAGALLGLAAAACIPHLRRFTNEKAA